MPIDKKEDQYAIGVNSKNSEYVSHFNEWLTCRTVMAGEDAVKLAGVRYLPCLSQQESLEYEAYKGRAMFYGGASRTRTALVGMLFRKKPIIKFSAVNISDKDDKKELLDDFIPGIETLDSFMHKIAREVMATGRVGILVDADSKGKSYLSCYKAEDILNWRQELRNGEQIFTMVVLREAEELYNGFKTRYRHRYRVLFLDTETAKYRQKVYVQSYKNESSSPSAGISGRFTTNPVKQSYTPASPGVTSREFLNEINSLGNGDSDERFELLEEFAPSISGVDLDRIPFYPVNSGGNVFELDRPPLLDLVNVNLSHYRTSADLEHGRHFTGLPTAWATGFDGQNKTFKIGSPELWTTTNEKAKVGFLEFTGQGLGSLENALLEKHVLMTVLGAKLLDSQQGGAASADAESVRRAGETSVLADIADIISDMISAATVLCARWNLYTKPKISIVLQKDYSSLGPNPQLLMALLQAVAAGALSYESLHHNLMKMDIIPDGVSAEEEFNRIQSTEMTLPSQMAIGTTKLGVRAEVSQRPGDTSPRKDRTPLERTIKNEAIGDK